MLRKVYLLLFLGVVISSTSSLLIRWIGDVPAAVIAFYRVSLSAFILFIYVLFRGNKPEKINIVFHWHYMLAGLFLALHFITWIASLQMTTIANSIFLEGTHPIFSLIVSAVFLKEYPALKSIPAFVIAVLGMFIIVYADFGLEQSRIIGDLLAISSAFFVALYFMIARIHKDKVDLIHYLIVVYGVAALASLIYIFCINDKLIGYTVNSWIFIILLAIGPNLLGHSLLNWASRQIEIFKVNLSLVLEPVLATIGGVLIFYEYPDATFFLGAGLIVLSLIYMIYYETRNNSIPLEAKPGSEK